MHTSMPTPLASASRPSSLSPCATPTATRSPNSNMPLPTSRTSCKPSGSSGARLPPAHRRSRPGRVPTALRRPPRHTSRCPTAHQHPRHEERRRKPTPCHCEPIALRRTASPEWLLRFLYLGVGGGKSDVVMGLPGSFTVPTRITIAPACTQLGPNRCPGRRCLRRQCSGTADTGVPALRPLGMGAQFHRVDGGAGLQGSHSYSRSATTRGNQQSVVVQN